MMRTTATVLGGLGAEKCSRWFYIENVLRLPCFAQISHSFSSYLLGQALFELGSIKILVFVELPTSLCTSRTIPLAEDGSSLWV